MKQKTLHAVVKYFYPVAAGIETNMTETYRHFVHNGWRVVVHTSTNTLTEEHVLSKEESIKGIAIQRYPWRIYGFIPDIAWESVDVVALHNFNIMPHGILLFLICVRKTLGKKTPFIMLTPHGGFTPDWEIFSPLVAMAKKLYHFTLGVVFICCAVDIVRAVSEWEAQEIIRHGIPREKVLTITNGLEDEAFANVEKRASPDTKKQVKKFGKYMIGIGRIYGIKNYETVLNAMISVPKNINFVIVGPVGDETYKKFLEDKIAALGLTHRVFFVGVIRGIDKYYLIKHAQLMVHMARWESFCNAVHEGMSQGKVCIVANVYALPYLVKDSVNGYCLQYNDASGLAKKITYVLKNLKTKEISRMQKTNQSTTRKQTWRMVSQMVQNNLV